MQTSKLNIGGGVVMWTADATNRTQLTDGLTALGLADLIPRPRTPKAILHEALKSRYADPTMLVRPLEKKSAFTIVREDRGDTENQYTNTMSADVDEDGNITLTPWNETELWMIEQAYNNAAGVVPAISVTRLLVQALQDLHGIALKPSGGVYWLPERRLERWGEIATVVEKAAIDRESTQIFLLRSVADADAMRTVRAGIIADISRALAEIEQDLEDASLGEVGLQARVDRAKALHAKLLEYEGVLGESLTEVQDKITAACSAAAEAVLLAASASVVTVI